MQPKSQAIVEYERVFPARFKALLEKRGITHYQLAKHLGLPARDFRFYELGLMAPNIGRLVMFGSFFDVSIDYLVGLSDNPSRE